MNLNILSGKITQNWPKYFFIHIELAAFTFLNNFKEIKSQTNMHYRIIFEILRFID